MSFQQNIHVEQDVEGRVDLYWEFTPSTGLVRDQRFAVMSIVAPEGTNQKAESTGIKIFGCFGTLLEANAYAKQLQSECDAFDFYVVETQRWAKLPPEVERLDDKHYQEETLEALKHKVVRARQAKVKFLEERMLADKAMGKARALEALTDADSPAEAEAMETDAGAAYAASPSPAESP